ncbi:PREDICTED: uncharacterized protein LOC108359872 [Rhagoletis zephyria]|uniref:uncharacterized protein LOC108359872 n=1 Tax=Rhagoletis zephyria TaxID=28612 RepID=UPI0008113DB2|nr:PREDICTED: uncharacterized protein LOC108359872 [Rhagoletis zephyria]
MHHVPLLLKFEFYVFPSFNADDKPKFNYAACDYPKLDRLLDELNWESLLSCPDVAKCIATFKSVISDFCFKFIPIIRKRPYKEPWYNRDLKKLKNLRNKFYNKFKASGSQFFFEKYQVHLKKFNCLNKFLYRNYILGIESNIKEDPKSFWHFIKSKKNNSSIPSAVFFEDKCASTPAEVANLFAAFFSSNFVDDNPTVDSSFSASVSSTNFGSLRLSSDDIANGILNLSASAKQDIDGLSSNFIKKCPALISPLKIIFSRSLASGIFYDELKLTSITPILKSGGKSDVCNYRPISKHSIISKLFEVIVKEKIYFATKSLVSPNQHGFVLNRSTVTNLGVFSEYCIAAISNGFQVDCIYTDLAKAFHRVSHSLLVSKLASVGFHSVFLQWLKSYLFIWLFFGIFHCLIGGSSR